MGTHFSFFSRLEQSNCRSQRHNNDTRCWGGIFGYFPIKWEVFFRVPKDTSKKDTLIKLAEWRAVIDQRYYCEKCREEISNSPYLRWTRLKYISY